MIAKGRGTASSCFSDRPDGLGGCSGNTTGHVKTSFKASTTGG